MKTGGALWTQQRSSGVRYERRRKVHISSCVNDNNNIGGGGNSCSRQSINRVYYALAPPLE